MEQPAISEQIVSIPLRGLGVFNLYPINGRYATRLRMLFQSPCED
jgi:hypothetical protein